MKQMKKKTNINATMISTESGAFLIASSHEGDASWASMDQWECAAIADDASLICGAVVRKFALSDG